MSELVFLSGTQLFDTALLPSNRDVTFLMVESDAWCRRQPFHQQKLALVLSAMRKHASELSAAGRNVHYYRLENDATVAEAIAASARACNATVLSWFDSEDQSSLRLLERSAERLRLRHRVLPSPMFLLDGNEVDNWFAGRKRPMMGTFYKAQRKKLGLLMDGGAPVGGRWSFDEDNRKRLPTRVAPPQLPKVAHSKSDRACFAEIEARFGDHAGQASELWLPTGRTGAIEWLERFLEERFIGFGSYEDALTTRSATLFHSTLSPLLNIGLLTPGEVVERAVAVAREMKVPLNDLEGFLRQLIGWREFVRGVYRTHRDAMRAGNQWGGDRALGRRWLDGTTGLDPLDRAMHNVRDLGWNHHIERLMILANLMNLAGVHPREAYSFFMTQYIDAYDWVMVPNVYGMGLTSDGGIFATRPYLCGSNYVRKMSDYPAGPWTDVMDGLYWRFIEKHRDALASNPRLGMTVRGLDRLDPTRRKEIFALAENFIATHTEPCS